MGNFHKEFSSFAKRHGFVKAATAKDILGSADLYAEEVIDVGVRFGTPFLYDSFSDAKFILCDPQPGGEALLRKRPKSYKFLQVGLASSNGEMSFFEYVEKTKLSGFLERRGKFENEERIEIKVNVTTLDSVISQECATNSIGIKNRYRRV